MENRLDQLKKDLVTDIKDLANSLSKADSFIGVVSQSFKFKEIQEKFIILRFLEEKRLSLNDFNLPIPTREEKQEILNQEGVFEDEEPVIFDFEVEPEENETTETQEDSVEEASTPEEAVEEKAPEEQNDSPVEPDSWEKEIQESADYDQIQEVKEVPPIVLDINDKIAFLNQLFLNDNESMDLVINTLNRIQDLTSSQQYLQDLKNEMGWDASQQEYLSRLETLVAKRFD